MKKYFTWFIPLLLFLSACAGAVSADPILPAATVNTAVVTQASPPTAVATTVQPTETLVPTATPAPESEAQQKIRAIMEAYGKVDEKYLTEAYWTKMAADIKVQGPANRILTLEFHGDNYNMYDGNYSMTPESFYSQMEYLMANNYHFVTGPETLGFLEGWLPLPARSVILTTDSGGGGSLASFPRIIADFQTLEAKYGYTPHLQSFIWTFAMEPKNSVRCKDDICWNSFRVYRDSGYFTFGSHTETHADFSTFDRETTTWDLKTNVGRIHDELGLNVYSLTWPFEVCSPYPDLVRQAGIKFAFGGNTRGLKQNFTYFQDPSPFCLPRLFPPNPDGYSGRPRGQSLEDMLSSAELLNPLK